MNLPALSAAIVHAIRNSMGDSAHNQATMVQGMIQDALDKEQEGLKSKVLNIAIECNCRAEHGAEGAEHLLAIEKMLRNAIKR